MGYALCVLSSVLCVDVGCCCLVRVCLVCGVVVCSLCVLFDVCCCRLLVVWLSVVVMCRRLSLVGVSSLVVVVMCIACCGLMFVC